MTGPEDNKPKTGTAKADGGAKAVPEIGARVILHLEEWAEPKGRKIISEFHKPGATELDALLDEEEKSDMDSFADYWGDRDSNKIYSEYHKDGAPYLDRPSSDNRNARTDLKVEDRPKVEPRKEVAVVKKQLDTEMAVGTEDKIEVERMGPITAKKATGNDEQRLPRPKVMPVAAPEPPVEKDGERTDENTEQGKTHRMSRVQRLERVIDINTIELLTFAVVRALFGRGVRVPIKREGIIDMEIVIKDKDIIFNTNEIMFEFPDMAIWRIVFAYKGKPIVEFGRGVKGRVRIHRMRLMAVLLRMWLHNLEVIRRRKKAESAPVSEETSDEGFF